jgi:hypothetical protein
MNFNVGDFAENLLKGGGAQTPAPPRAPQPVEGFIDEQAPDISNVRVPDGFVNGLVERKAPAPVEAAPIKEDSLNEDIAEMKAMLGEMKTLLVAVGRLLSEQTGVGSIGVNMAGPQKKKETSEEMLKRLRAKKR